MLCTILNKLCDHHNVKPNVVTKQIGLSRAPVTNWRIFGRASNGYTLSLAANYFNCFVDCFPGHIDSPVPSFRLSAAPLALRVRLGLTKEIALWRYWPPWPPTSMSYLV